MAVIAGIDEAGFGPVLGPLVVSATAMSMPDELADVSMWELLAGAVARKPSPKNSRRPAVLAVADSKKLYKGLRSGGGVEHLERGVLAMLATRGELPDSLEGLLEAVAPGADKHVGDYPWYCRGSSGQSLSLPYSATAVSVKLAANSLTHRMSDVGMKLAMLRSEPIFVGQFNRMVEATRNKSAVLFSVTGRLVMHLWNLREKLTAGEVFRIYVDRQGGRMRYLPGLQRMFPGCRFKILDESDSLSAYRITEADQPGGEPRSVEIYFATAAEDRQLPVALASMTSKYVRELFMVMFNRFWGACVEGLEPTAGYYTDGRRFYGEIQPAISRLGVSESIIYRSR